MAGEHQPPSAAVAVTGILFDSQNHDVDPLPTQPIVKVAQQSPPQQQPPHSETLVFQKPQSDQNDVALIIPDAHNQQSGIIHTDTTLPNPIILESDSETLISPQSFPRRHNKRKKGGNRKTYKHKSATKKILNLTDSVNLIPFIPKALDLYKHENVLKRLGLYNFSKVKLDRSIRTDLVVQFIANYDPKKRCSHVNDKRIRVNRADLARALQLPSRKHDNKASVDLDSEEFSAEEIGFVDDFVFNWMLLHEESWIMPEKIVNLTRCVRDGHPEKLDSASLIWYKVEKELTQGVKLVDCYYASHFQQLIRSQCGRLLEVDEVKENVEDDEEDNEKVCVVQEDDVEMTIEPDVEKILCQADDDEEHNEKLIVVQEDDVQKTVHQAVRDDGDEEHNEKVYVVQEDDVELTLAPDDEKTVHRAVRDDDDEEHNEKVFVVQEDDVELTLGPDVEKTLHQAVSDDGDEVHNEKVSVVQEDNMELTLGPDVEKVVLQAVRDGDEEHNEKVSVVQEDNVELTLGPDVEKTLHQAVRDDDDDEHNEKVPVVQEDNVELTSGPNVEKVVLQAVRDDDDDEEHNEKVSVVKEDNMELTLGPDVDKEVLQAVRDDDKEHNEKVSVVQEDNVELMLGPDVEKVMHQVVRDDDVEHNEKVFVVQEDNMELTVGPDVDKVVHQVVRDDDEEEHNEKVSVVQEEDVEKTVHQDVRDEDESMVEVEEMEEQVNWKSNLSEHILQRCQSSDLNNNVEDKVENIVDEQIEQVEDEEGGGDDGGERFVEGFDMEANDDSMDGDGLTDHIPYSSHGISHIDLFGSRDDSFMSPGGPSFFDNNNNNNGKRVLESEDDTHHLNGNSKRLKTDEMWDEKQNEFGFCMVQMQQWIEKAKMINDSKEEIHVSSKYHQDSAMSELQNRQQVMEMIIKSKDAELEQKHAQVFRLERELYLLEDLLAEYRTALNDARFKFSEYRKRCAVQEEPLYKDAGPGGLVLSTRELETRELEKQRLKLEEHMMNFQAWAKGFEEERVYQLEILSERVVKMAEKLVFVGNEVKTLKEIATQRKETQKPRDELQLSPGREENQKSHDEVPDNDAAMEVVPNDADESEEKGGVEEH